MKKFQLLVCTIIIVIFTLSFFGCNKVDRLEPIKNIIIVIGDGMGPVHEQACRDEKDGPLSWDDYGYCCETITDSTSDGPTDSAASGTALATGTKTSNGYVGKDIFMNDLLTIFDYAKEEGKKTGIVVSDLLSGATPAAFSGHASDRNNTDDIIPSQATSNVDLLLGAYLKDYDKHLNTFLSNGYSYYETLSEVQLSEGKILGLFSDVTTHGNGTTETLQDMTQFALDYLHNEEGFVLMLEGAKIDKRSHDQKFGLMIDEHIALDECVDIINEWMEDNQDTLVIVTADHECGGLIFDGEEYIFTTDEHTKTYVNCHVSWPYDFSPFEEYYRVVEDAIDNTDIFKIMAFAMGLNLEE